MRVRPAIPCPDFAFLFAAALAAAIWLPALSLVCLTVEISAMINSPYQ
jgi:hypothetical protein